MKKILFTFTILLTVNIFAQAPDTLLSERFYLRKSVSYYDGIILGKGVSVPNEILKRILNGIKKTLTIERFDYNPIPSYLQQDIVSEAQKIDSLTVDKLAGVIERVFLPEILRILEVAKETRTKEFVSNQERVNFLTTKAKDLGVTAEDIEKVMNAAYIYVPFITHYEVKKDEEANLVSVSLEGGIIWYNVAMKFSPPKVVPVAKRSNLTGGVAKLGKDKTYLDFATGEKLDPVQFATNSALKAFIKNIQVLTRSIPDFSLSSDIMASFKGNYSFKLGNKEGIMVDDKFDIVEFYEDENGIRRPKSIGCALVRKVANNKDTAIKEILYSSAKSFIGRGEEGMTLIERPRLPIDVVLRYAVLSENKWGLDLEFDFNIGRYFGVSQLFLPMNLMFSPSTDYTTDEKKIKLDLTELGTGLIKKFYLNRFIFGGEGKITLAEGIGGDIRGLLEIWLIPDLTLGTKLGYSFGLYSGFTWGVHFGYNPPTLPFDPFDTLRGLLEM